MIRNDDTRVISSHKTTKQNTLSALITRSIESINVLKDASAVAIYGNKAQRGAIVVTLKKVMILVATIKL